MLMEYFDCRAEGALIREAVNASLSAGVATPDITGNSGRQFGTSDVGAWIVDYINLK